MLASSLGVLASSGLGASGAGVVASCACDVGPRRPGVVTAGVVAACDIGPRRHGVVTAGVVAACDIGPRRHGVVTAGVVTSGGGGVTAGIVATCDVEPRRPGVVTGVVDFKQKELELNEKELSISNALLSY